MAAVTAALVGFFAFIILRVTAPQMSPAVHRPVVRGLRRRS
jgi:hypothetical protein